MDTGATLTFIDTNWALENRLTIEPIDQTASSINGTQITFQGKAKVQFQIGPISLNEYAVVLDNSVTPCVIGVDILQQLGPIQLDYVKRHVILGNSKIPLATESTFCSRLSVTQTIEIPPCSAAHVSAKLDINPTVKTALFEPNERFAGYPLKAFDTVAHIENGTFPVLIHNHSNSPVKLYEDSTLGHVGPILQKPPQTQSTADERQNKDTDVTQLFSWENCKLTPPQMEKLHQLIRKFKNVFAKHDYDLGHLKTIEHRIETGDNPPVKQRPYRVPQILKEDLRNHLTNLLEHDVIRQSSSPFASPCLLVKKKDGTTRLVIDYRRLNKITTPQFQLLPHLEDITEALHGAKYFSVLDMNAGYHQISMAEEHKHKTAFITNFGKFEYNRLPFGLNGSPATFISAIDAVLNGLLFVDCFSYLDDIIIFSTDFESHLQKLERVFKRLIEHGVKLKPRKCEFLREEVKFLGHVMSRDGLRPAADNTEKIKNYPTPRNVKETRTFLGICTYYRKFCENFAKLAKPLFNLTAKSTKFEWGESQNTAFQTLKQILTSEPLLIFPDFTKPFYLQTDASNFAIGAVLSQMTQHGDQPIAYASRVLTKTEQNFSTVEKEACALIFAVRHFKDFLWGRKFFCIVDHAPLKFLQAHKEVGSRLMRWSLFLQNLISK